MPWLILSVPGIWTKQENDNFVSLLNTLKWAIYLDAARSLALAQISSSLKPNHHSRVKLVQIPDIYDTNKWTEKNISESQKYENHEIDMNPGVLFTLYSEVDGWPERVRGRP